MKYIFNTLLLLLLPLSLIANQQQVQVEYLPDVPVIYTVDITRTTKLADQQSSSSQSIMKIIASKSKYQSNRQASRFPINLNLVVGSYTQIFPQAKELNKTVIFPCSPFTLTFNSPSKGLDSQTKDSIQNKLSQIIEPKLSKEIVNYLNDFTSSLMSLPEGHIYVGQPLNQGQFIESYSNNPLLQKIKDKLNQTITYDFKGEITEVTAKEIKAKYQLSFLLVFDEKAIELMKILFNNEEGYNIKGVKYQVQSEGSISWNRENAMLFHRESEMVILTKAAIEKTSNNSSTPPLPLQLNTEFKIKSLIDSKLLD